MSLWIECQILHQFSRRPWWVIRFECLVSSPYYQSVCGIAGNVSNKMMTVKETSKIGFRHCVSPSGRCVHKVKWARAYIRTAVLSSRIWKKKDNTKRPRFLEIVIRLRQARIYVRKTEATHSTLKRVSSLQRWLEAKKLRLPELFISTIVTYVFWFLDGLQSSFSTFDC